MLLCHDVFLTTRPTDFVYGHFLGLGLRTKYNRAVRYINETVTVDTIINTIMDPDWLLCVRNITRYDVEKLAQWKPGIPVLDAKQEPIDQHYILLYYELLNVFIFGYMWKQYVDIGKKKHVCVFTKCFISFLLCALGKHRLGAIVLFIE
jgi:hypothetical protein